MQDVVTLAYLHTASGQEHGCALGLALEMQV